VSWNVTFSLVGLDSVMPLLVSQLTDSAPVIGLTGTVYSAGWLLPQLIVARLITAQPRKKPYMLAGLVGRIMFWGTAIALWSGLAARPEIMLAVFFFLLGFFTLTDSVTVVALFDVMSRVLPVKRRGRMFGLGQAIGGALGIGVGAVVANVLSSPRLPFPSNFALLFTLAGMTILPSTLSLALLREPPSTEERDGETSPRSGAPAGWGWLRSVVDDSRFRHMMACQILVTLLQLASPFFVVHASQVVGLPQRVVGSFVIALAISGVASSAALGWVSERWGPRSVIRVGSSIAMLGPLLALAVHFATGLGRAYALVFVALGVANSIRLLGFRTYLMGIAREGMRPAYIGTANTILGGLTLAPLLGGWLLEATSYVTLFATTVLVVGLGFLLSLTLKPAHDEPALEP
jgi:MFS family permease